MSQTKKAIIIGAGVAGLATAIRLAVQGFAVEVFEKNAHPGGKLSHFQLEDFKFDAGPSLFTQPENITALFELAGEPVENYLQYDQVPVACRYFYENGVVLEGYADAHKLGAALEAAVGEDPKNVTDYLLRAQNVYDNIGKIFLDYSLHTKDIFSAPIGTALKHTSYDLLFKSMHQVNTSSFTRPETIQLFDRFATYNGSNPYKAPGMLSLIPHLELNLGTYYPRGGMISITNALFALAQKRGVQFYFNQPVQRIIENEGKVYGVVTNNTNCMADTVVSNMDVYFTYKYLLNNDIKARKILKRERSSSAIIFYWGINKTFPQLHLHNIFFSKDYKQEFDHLFKTKTLTNDPTVYVNITSKMEEGHAPVGKENWFVMVNAPANVGQNWPEVVAQCRKAVIEKLSRLFEVNMEALIETEQVLDPIGIEANTGSYMGSLYGTSSNSKWAAFMRHPNFCAAIKGLYFAGGSVHPGGGIPLCLKSASLVSKLIASNAKKSAQH